MGKKKNTSGEARISPLFLEHVKMSSFGKFSNIIVGSFSPGLNVVYGPNEAGKTTLNELVKGVLFGCRALGVRAIRIVPNRQSV